MGMKVAVTTTRGAHYLAGCNSCEWGASIGSDGNNTRASVRNAIRKHVGKTGHSVWLDSTTTSNYFPLLIDIQKEMQAQ